MGGGSAPSASPSRSSRLEPRTSAVRGRPPVPSCAARLGSTSSRTRVATWPLRGYVLAGRRCRHRLGRAR
jgi:hypothetical protein